MPRYFYAGLLIVSMVITALVFYRTNSLLSEPSIVGEFGGVSLRIDVASTSESQVKGLSGRARIPGDYGMFFVFQKDGMYGFWMKDMLTPIDIFWLDDKGQVISIAEEVATSSYPNVFYPSAPARYVLETMAGFARAHNIATGTKLMLKNFPIVSE